MYAINRHLKLCPLATTPRTPQPPVVPLPLQALSAQTPSTQAPPTRAPSTEAPPTQAPPMQAPSTEAPPAQAPSTQAPPVQALPVQAPPVQALLASLLSPTAELPLPMNTIATSNNLSPMAELPLLTNVMAPPTYNPDTVCCLPCRSAMLKITLIVHFKCQRAPPPPTAFVSYEYYINKVYILVVLRTKKELPVLEYIDRVSRLNNCTVTLIIRLSWHRTAIYFSFILSYLLSFL